MNFHLEFGHKEVGNYVKKYLLTNHTACLPLSLFFSVGEYTQLTLDSWIHGIIWCGFNQCKVSTMLSYLVDLQNAKVLEKQLGFGKITTLVPMVTNASRLHTIVSLAQQSSRLIYICTFTVIMARHQVLQKQLHSSISVLNRMSI